MTYNLDEYVDVAERIQLFYSKYPEGRLETTHHEVVEVDGKAFAVCLVAASREPDDPRPCHGLAWEPIPGPTPFTRDSELMNAQTSAWGRAIVAVGIPSKKIASSDEVRARSADGHAAPSDSSGEKRTEKQNRELHAVLGKLDEKAPRPDGPWKDYARTWISAQFEKQSSTQLTESECDDLIKHLNDLLKREKVPFS